MADTPSERVAIQLDAFNSECGPKILEELAGYIEQAKTGTFNLQIVIVKGEIKKLLFRPDWTLALDGDYDG